MKTLIPDVRFWVTFVMVTLILFGIVATRVINRPDKRDDEEADQVVGDVPSFPQGWRGGGQRHGDRLRRLRRSRADDYREAAKPEVDRLKMLGVMEDFNRAEPSSSMTTVLPPDHNQRGHL